MFSGRTITNFDAFDTLYLSRVQIYNPLIGFQVYGSNTTTPVMEVDAKSNLSTFNSDLTVNGTVTFTSIVIHEIVDPQFGLASGYAADLYDCGFYETYNTNRYRGLCYDVTDGYWKFYTGNPTKPTTTVDSPDTYLDHLRVLDLQIRDGTVGAPAVQFVNETNMGLYRTGASSMGFAVGGVLRTTITDTGLRLYSGFSRYCRTEASAVNYTLVGTDDVVEISTTNNIAINVPAAASYPGKEYYIIKTGASGTLTITRNGADTFDGADTTIALSVQYDRVRLTSNGVSIWYSG